MAPQSVLLCLRNFHSIYPQIFCNETEGNKIIKAEVKEEGFVQCIRFIESLPNDTSIVLNFISDPIGIENDVADGLLALLLSLEIHFKNNFQFNWILFDCDSGFETAWCEAFPFINFVIGSLSDDSSTLNIPNVLSLPQIGQVFINMNSFLNLNTSGSLINTLKKEQVKGFTSQSIPLDPSRPIIIPPKFQINSESDGILFQIHYDNQQFALVFLDLCAKTLNFIDPVFIPFFKKNYCTDFSISSSSAAVKTNADSPRPNNKWLDRSFSLSDWTNEDSMDEDSLKKNNKMKLKKLILLSLRGIGIKKGDKQFIDIWKHLYCGCIFSLRKELSTVDLDQNVLLKTIRENIKFLNL